MKNPHHDDAATLEPVEPVRLPKRPSVPCLTIIAHPDPTRIGARALLSDLHLREIAVSRISPVFALPGQPGQILGDPYLSRSPCRIHRGPTTGSVLIDPGCVDIQVEGASLRTAHVCLPEALRAGVALRLSSRIALLLHTTHVLEQSGDERALLGHSDAMHELRNELRSAATSDAPALILGETGTGKELVARQLHQLSSRADRPFLPVNMATLSESTAPSVLFGHTRGAFTGATQRHHGLFQRAHGGTLFLDEIGDTPSSVQPMLLRALETGRVLPMGDEREYPVDVRVIAATDRDLDLAAASGTFRLALLHRLSAVEIHVPTLRERRADISLLFVHFLAELDRRQPSPWLACSTSAPDSKLSADLLLGLLRRPFPGNVRELRNLAQRMLHSGALEDASVPRKLDSNDDTARKRTWDSHELRTLLVEHGWSPSRVARSLGVANSTVHYWMSKHGLARRAVDLSDDELALVGARCNGDLATAASDLGVSERGLRLRLNSRQRKSCD